MYIQHAPRNISVQASYLYNIDIFHETIRQISQDIPAATNISNDIIIFGENREKHLNELHIDFPIVV